MEYIFCEHISIINQVMAELRNKEIQQDRLRFRQNLERLGSFMAYEISKKLSYEQVLIETPLGQSKSYVLEEQLVLATILRAGLPFYQGFIKVFEKADSAFIGAYRVENEEDVEVVVNMDYLATPDLTGKTLIIIDPMLATGKSLVKAYNALVAKNKPKNLHIVAAIGSKPGRDYVKQEIPNANLWIGDLDDTLNKDAYIVPGLGDAGDLSFGAKI